MNSHPQIPPDESLSALLDGELDEQEVESVARSLVQNPALRARWRRYQLASDSLRGDLPATTDPALLDRIGAAIAAEPVYTAPHHWRRKRRPTWLQQAGGLAIAASVTALSIFAAQALLRDPAAEISGPAAAPVAAKVSPSAIGTPASNGHDDRSVPNFELATYRSSAAADAAAQRLDALLLDHQRYQATHALQGDTLPFVRIINSPAAQRTQ